MIFVSAFESLHVWVGRTHPKPRMVRTIWKFLWLWPEEESTGEHH